MEGYVAETKSLTKYYKEFCALEQVNISVARGQIYGLIGDNGAGKTTILKLLAGQIFPTEGEIRLFGEYEPAELERVRQRTGVLIENPGFYPQLSVEKNLEYYRIQKGIPGRETVEEMLDLTGLAAARRKKAKALSLGMKQRLGLAIALMGYPEFLILDEPINGLDPSGIVGMRNLLLKLNREKNITILLSSHILSELEQIADMYGFVQNGKLLEQISGKDLRRKCADYVEIEVSDPEKYAVLLERKLGQEEYRIMPDRKIRIFHGGHKMEAYSGLASDAGMSVLSLARYSQPLEEYYIELKKGGK